MEEQVENVEPRFGNLSLKYESELTEEFKEMARTELRETPEVVAEALEEFRELMKGEPNLHVSLDDNLCSKFLRPCKWYPKSAFSLAKRYYRFKHKFPNVCDNMRIDENLEPFTKGYFVFLPLRDRNGSRIVLISISKHWDPKVISIYQMFRALIITANLLLSEPATQVAGAQAIFDLNELCLRHVTYITPSFARMMTEWIQRCLPGRLKGVHVVNQPVFFSMVFALFKPFLQEKLRNRLIFHGKNRESLHSYFEPEVLPTRLQGRIDTSDKYLSSDMAAFVRQHKHHVEGDINNGYRTDNDK